MRDVSPAQQACPQAPPELASVQARALHRACLVVGGVPALARKLEVDEATLERWLRGEEAPSEPAFLQAVEILLLFSADAGGRPT